MNPLHALAPGFAVYPLFQHLVMASIELAMVVGFVHLLVVLFRLRCPRLICLLWLVALTKPLVSMTVGSPLAIPVFDAPPASAIPAAETRRPAVAPPAKPVTSAPASGHASVRPSPALPKRPIPRLRTTARPAQNNQPKPILESGNWFFQLTIGIWLAGTGVCLARYLSALLRLRASIRAAHKPTPSLEATYRDMTRYLAIKHPPRVLVSDRIESPALVGVLRPVILLPEWHTAKGDDYQVSWSLRHELIHWQHLDPLCILIRDITRILFWFHPAAWWGARRLTESLETACDQALVHSPGQASQYAECLFEVLRTIRDRRRIGLVGGLFVTRTQIGRRIAALLDGSVTTSPRLTVRSLAGTVFLSAAIFAVGATVRHPNPRDPLSREFLVARSVRFPQNRSLGSCFFVDREAVANQVFSDAMLNGIPSEVDARGTVAVPAGQILALDVTPDTFRVERPFAHLTCDHIQLLTFQHGHRATDKQVQWLSDLNGLIGLNLCGAGSYLNEDPPLSQAAIASLASLKQLRYLSLPSEASPEAITALAAFPSLVSLQIKAPEGPDLPGPCLTEAHFAAIARLTSLTSLSIVGGRPGPAAELAHLGQLRSLRSLSIVHNDNPELNRHLQCLSSLPSLEELSFSDSALNDEGLAQLRSLTRLRRLDLKRCAVGDPGLVHLANLSKLEDINLTETPVGNAGLQHLAGLRQLRTLVLERTHVTDAGLASLSGLTSLEQLWLPGPAITDEGFAYLSRIRSLKQLGPINSSRLTDAGLKSLPDMVALETLNIRASHVTDAAMPYLAQCTSLRELGLSASISDSGLAQLAQLKGLRKLTLHNMRLTGEGLGALDQLPQLAELNLIRITLDPGGLQNLSVPPSLRNLRLSLLPEVTDDDLVVLAGLKDLTSLFIRTPGLTDRGIENLAGLQSVEKLWITGEDLQVTDAGLQTFEHLPALQFLAMRGTRVSDQGLRALCNKLPGLSVLPYSKYATATSPPAP